MQDYRKKLQLRKRSDEREALNRKRVVHIQKQAKRGVHNNANAVQKKLYAF